MPKLANYAFHGENLKGMVPATVASVEMMVERWRHHEGNEIEVFQEFKILTSEIIPGTAFGNSYLEGDEVFDMLKKMIFIVARNHYKMNIIIKESLRLYPPVFHVTREVKRSHNGATKYSKQGRNIYSNTSTSHTK